MFRHLLIYVPTSGLVTYLRPIYLFNYHLLIYVLNYLQLLAYDHAPLSALSRMSGARAPLPPPPLRERGGREREHY